MTFRELELEQELQGRTWREHSAERGFSSGIYRQTGKRLLDLILSMLLMPVLLPVMAVIWGLIRAMAAMRCSFNPGLGVTDAFSNA